MDHEIDYEEPRIRPRGRRVGKCYFLYTLVKVVSLFAVLMLTPYDEKQELYVFLMIYTVLELCELFLLIVIYVLNVLYEGNRCKNFPRLAGISCECLRLISVVGISIELLNHSDWITSPIGFMSVFIVLVSFIKLILFSILLLFICVLLRSYLVALRSENSAQFDREILNSFIVDSVQEGTECSICLEHCGRDKEWVVLSCQHSFHHQCLDDWVIIRGICPICRRNIND